MRAAVLLLCVALCVALASCKGGSTEDQPDHLGTPGGSISAETDLVKETPEEAPPEETPEETPEEEVHQPDYYYKMYSIGSDHVICLNPRGFDVAEFEKNELNADRNMEDVHYYSLSFVVYTDAEYDTLRITDKETGENLSAGDYSSSERHVFHMETDNVFETYDAVFVTLMSLDEYTMDDIKVELGVEDGYSTWDKASYTWTEVPLTGSVEDLKTGVGDLDRYKLLKIGTEYYIEDDMDSDDGNGYECRCATFRCMTRSYSHSLCETGITSADVRFYDAKTWQEVELPAGTSVYYEENYEDALLEIRAGVQITDSKLCDEGIIEKFVNDTVVAVEIGGEPYYIVD